MDQKELRFVFLTEDQKAHGIDTKTGDSLTTSTVFGVTKQRELVTVSGSRYTVASFEDKLTEKSREVMRRLPVLELGRTAPRGTEKGFITNLLAVVPGACGPCVLPDGSTGFAQTTKLVGWTTEGQLVTKNGSVYGVDPLNIPKEARQFLAKLPLVPAPKAPAQERTPASPVTPVAIPESAPFEL
jgi:hypothetical protein